MKKFMQDITDIDNAAKTIVETAENERKIALADVKCELEAYRNERMLECNSELALERSSFDNELVALENEFKIKFAEKDQKMRLIAEQNIEAWSKQIFLSVLASL